MICRKVILETLGNRNQITKIEFEQRMQDAIRFFIWNSSGQNAPSEAFEPLLLHVLTICAREFSVDEDKLLRAFGFAAKNSSACDPGHERLH